VAGEIFEPFYSTKGSSGLGLATCQAIVEQAGGRISAESAAGGGTTFRVALPARDGTVAPAPEAPPLAQAGGGDETLLLVEDEPMLLRLLESVLGSRGYRLLTARNGLEALSVVEVWGGPIDLVVTDVVMPVMSGDELARALRGSHPELKILFVSGYDEGRLGDLPPGSAFLAKPFLPDALARKVRELLDR
jgi:CheY-like chemotaxis protein